MEIRRIGPEIRRLNNLLKRETEKSAARAGLDGLTGLHGWVIGFIARQEGPVFQRDLEERFSVRRSTMSNILSLMEKNGLITRAPSKKDGRAKQITLTPRAVAIDRFVRQDIKRLEAVITKNISEEELKCFFSTIDKIKNNLEVQDD